MKHTMIWKCCLCGAVALTLLLTACGEKKELPSAGEMLDTLQEQVTFTDEMIEKNKDETLLFYNIDGALVSDATALVGSGATAEMLSVWQAPDAQSAQKITEFLQDFNANWQEGYSDYKPEEVPKLETAVVRQQGTVVVYAVTAENDGAADAVDALLG